METITGYECSVFYITKDCARGRLWCYCSDYFTVYKMSLLCSTFLSSSLPKEQKCTRIAQE